MEGQELVVDYGSGCGSVLIQNHTLADARQMIMDEFDDDMIPSDDWVFFVNGVRKTKKQETKQVASQFVGKHVVIGPKDMAVKRSLEHHSCDSNNVSMKPPPSSSKRMKLDPGAECNSGPSSHAITPSNVGEIETDKASSSSLNSAAFATDTNKKSSSSTSNDKCNLSADDSSNDEGVVKDMDPVKLTDRLDQQVAKSNVDDKKDCKGKDDDNVDEELDDEVNSTDSSIVLKDSDDDDESGFVSDDQASVSGSSDLEVTQVDPAPGENPHKEADEALTTCRKVIKSIEEVLNQEHFCSETRRAAWLKETTELLQKARPKTVIGVLGNTGVGKSSLLNALLDEANVLPTSGSRGCTAAVVELTYNKAMMQRDNRGDEESDEIEEAKEVPVYRGVVEFMALSDWLNELKILVDECSTQEKNIYAIPPMEENMPDAAAAWQKIDQVYGRGTMEKYVKFKANIVFERLSKDPRVRRLLTAQTPGAKYNLHNVEEGKCVPASEKASNLITPNNARNRRSRKNWAKSFRSKINNYVYRTGNGDEPQMWPLIRKVQLFGPWSTLSTGACLVDLPGVRDANIARAKVSEQYLQNCSQVWIVAPIKRAVDDGTAKELLGEQFKRRLLMDGKYDSIAFICTQTDDIESSETMRDHSDVAERLGHWEKMKKLASQIAELEHKENEKLQEKEDITAELGEAKESLKEARDDLQRAIEGEERNLDEMKGMVGEAKQAKRLSVKKLEDWRHKNEKMLEKDRARCAKFQKQLKTLCSIVRNEYSSKCLQEDFQAGLKELYRNADDSTGNNRNKDATELPQNLQGIELPVFACSSNDYLKLLGIKESRDGPASCFSRPADTQVPKLRQFVHGTTANVSAFFASNFVEQTNDLLDRVKLLATDSKEAPTGRVAYRLKSTFDSEMRKLGPSVSPIAKEFSDQANKKVSDLKVSLNLGARAGNTAAMGIVQSWGSTSRRSKHERTPERNGLYWSTYFATARRSGVYTSASAGPVDFNQELLDPMEEKFSTTWQNVMDSSIRTLLSASEAKTIQVASKVASDLSQSLSKVGIDRARLAAMITTSTRSCLTVIKAQFRAMSSTAADSQREISRDLLPQIRDRMDHSYRATIAVPGGSGKFERMKCAMRSTSHGVVNSMFVEAMGKVLSSIDNMIKELTSSINNLEGVLHNSFSNVFSICWDGQAESKISNPEIQKKVSEARVALLPEINRLGSLQDKASTLMGVERQQQDLELMEVDTLDQRLAKELKEAEKRGDAFDLCDSDVELDVKPKAKVKSKRKRPPAKEEKVNGVLTIDLCDSDEDVFEFVNDRQRGSGAASAAARIKKE